MLTLLPKDVKNNETFLIEEFFHFSPVINDNGGAP
jgi:hypothetical protein